MSVALSTTAPLNDFQVDTLLKRFDQFAPLVGQEQAFASILESFGNESVENACTNLKKELKRLNQGKCIETNPILRLHAAIKKYNSNIDKCCIVIAGVEGLTPEERKALRIEIPEALGGKSQTYTSNASFQGEDKRLSISLII